MSLSQVFDLHGAELLFAERAIGAVLVEEFVVRALLRDTPFVSYHPSLHQHALQMAAVHDHIGPPPQVVAASSADVILALVAAGLGYSIVPWLDPRGPRLKGVVTLTPEGHDQRFPIIAAWSRQSPVAGTLRALLPLMS